MKFSVVFRVKNPAFDSKIIKSKATSDLSFWSLGAKIQSNKMINLKIQFSRV